MHGNDTQNPGTRRTETGDLQPDGIKHLGIHGVAAPLLRLQYLEETGLRKLRHRFIRYAHVGFGARPARLQRGTQSTLTLVSAPAGFGKSSLTAAWAEKSGVSYVSPYWAGQFFSYIDWTPALDAAPYAQLSESFNAQVRQAFQAQQLTRYGEKWLAQL